MAAGGEGGDWAVGREEGGQDAGPRVGYRGRRCGFNTKHQSTKEERQAAGAGQDDLITLSAHVPFEPSYPETRRLMLRRGSLRPNFARCWLMVPTESPITHTTVRPRHCLFNPLFFAILAHPCFNHVHHYFMGRTCSTHSTCHLRLSPLPSPHLHPANRVR